MTSKYGSFSPKEVSMATKFEGGGGGRATKKNTVFFCGFPHLVLIFSVLFGAYSIR